MDDGGDLPAGIEVRVELLAPDGGADGDGFAVSHRIGAANEAGVRALAVSVRRDHPTPVERGVRVRLDLPTGTEPPAWLIPGLFYGENRPSACRRLFPRYARGVRDAAAMTSETWSFRADRAATPAVFAWSAGRMAAIATEETTALGPAGIGFEGSASRTAIWVDLPWREEPVAYRGDGGSDPPDVRTRRWTPGDEMTVDLELATDGPDRHGYVPFLRHRWERMRGRPRPWVGVEAAARLAADGLLRWHYHPEHRALYETASFDRAPDDAAAGSGDRPHMHVGWVSGAPWAAQLLAWGRRVASERHLAAGTAVLDHIAENLSPSGTFWAEWTQERGWGTGWSPAGTIHANTIGQATLFFLRALTAEDGHGASHPGWEAAVRSNLDALADRQRADGSFGTYHEAATGTVTEWDGAGPLTWIAALLDGAARYGVRRYRDAALRAGGHYRRYVDDELIYGAPEDVHLAPSSEDGSNAVIAFTALHRFTGDPQWLDVARRAADWTLSWRYAYDVAFDQGTVLGGHAFATTGTDQASSANQHLHHFGLLCQPELVELSRLTGDGHYRRRAAETLRAWRQGLVRHDGDLGGRQGMVPERFHQTDCHAPKGSIGPLSHAWSAGVLLFACLDALEDLDALSA